MDRRLVRRRGDGGDVFRAAASPAAASRRCRSVGDRHHPAPGSRAGAPTRSNPARPRVDAGAGGRRAQAPANHPHAAAGRGTPAQGGSDPARRDRLDRTATVDRCRTDPRPRLARRAGDGDRIRIDPIQLGQRGGARCGDRGAVAQRRGKPGCRAERVFRRSLARRPDPANRALCADPAAQRGSADPRRYPRI